MLNKQVLLALGMIVFIGAVLAAGTGAFFSSQAQATNNVFTAGTLTLELAHNENGNYEPTKSAAWVFDDMAPGGIPVEDSIWMQNTGSVDGMSLGVALANANTTEPGMGEKMRITKMTLGGSNLLENGAGASAADYEEPINCDVNVTPGGLSAAVTGATAGQTICVDSGVYNPGSLTVSAANVTIVGLNEPGGVDSAEVNGTFTIAANNVTIKGLEIMNPTGSFGIVVNGADNAQILNNVIHDIGSDSGVEGSAQAVYLKGDASVVGFTVMNNEIYNIGHTALDQGAGSGSSAKGVYIGDSTGNGTITGALVNNNMIYDIKASTAPWGAVVADRGRGAYGVLVNYGSNGGGANTGTTAIIVTNNTITDLEGLWSHAVGLEGSTPSANVAYNDISDVVDHKSPSDTDSVGVMIEDNPNAGSVTINNNNFGPNVLFGIRNVTGTAVNGQNNWWGDFDLSDNVSGSVNTNGEKGGPISGFINGNDWNTNGYADLQDLYNEPLIGASVTLDAGEKKLFEMAVQLDGPTTGNEFQGDTYNTDLVFTLNQI